MNQITMLALDAPTAIARGGEFEGLMFFATPDTVHMRVKRPDGTAELYLNTRRQDEERPDLARFDLDPHDPRLAEEADASARADDELMERLKGKPGSEDA